VNEAFPEPSAQLSSHSCVGAEATSTPSASQVTQSSAAFGGSSTAVVITLPKVIENAPATPAPAAVSSESRSEFGAGLHRFRGERGTRMATHITTYTPAGMASARKGAPENCSCTSGSGSVFSGDGPTGRVRQRLRSTARGRGVRETESTAEHGRMQRSPCPLERGLEYKNTRFPSRSPAKHRAEDNAGDSDEQRQPLEIGEVLPHLRTQAGAISVRCRGRVGGMASGGCRVPIGSVSEVSRKCLEVSLPAPGEERKKEGRGQGGERTQWQRRGGWHRSSCGPG